MSQGSDDRCSDIERQLHAIELKNEVREIVGGDMQGFESESMDPVIEEQFWENVLEYEKAPLTTAQHMLERQGVRLPDPDALSDESIGLKLWEIIDGLAKKNIFLQCTDHLSDRELYGHLIKESLVERMPDLPVRKNSAYHIDIIGSGSEEDTLLYHRFYADNRSRRLWIKDFAVISIVLLCTAVGCQPQPSAPRIDASKVRVGMSGSEVRKAVGEPFPGATNANAATGYRQETWIYPSGDNALFVVVENDRVKTVTSKRVTMKDAARKVRKGMTQAEVISALGQPSGVTGDIHSKATATYVNDEAALDDLTIHFENGVVTGFQVNPNSALSR